MMTRTWVMIRKATGICRALDPGCWILDAENWIKEGKGNLKVDGFPIKSGMTTSKPWMPDRGRV